MRHREMWTEPRAIEEAAARSGDGQPFRWPGVGAELQRPVTHVVEQLVVGERAGRELVQVLFQFWARQLAGVHQEKWFLSRPAGCPRLHAGHPRGNLRGEKAEALQADAALDLPAQVVEAKSAVADRRWSGAVVEDGDRDRIEDGADAKRAQRPHQPRAVKVAQLELARPVRGGWRVDDADPHGRYAFQVVVEGPGCVRGRIPLQPCFEMGLARPGAGAAAHGDAPQRKVDPVLGGLLDSFGQQRPRGGHYELNAVLYHCA